MFKTPRENCSTLTSVFDLTLHGFVEGADTTALRLLSRHCKQSGNGLTATVLRPLPVSFTACLLSQLFLFLSLLFFALYLYRKCFLSTDYVFALIRGTSSTIQSVQHRGGQQ